MGQVEDATIALARLSGVLGLIPDPSQVVVFTHPGEPLPKARARWSAKSRSMYTPSTTQAEERALAWEFRYALGRRPQFTDTVALVALFYVGSRQRKDVDNLLKLVMDGATKAGVWMDDSQVTVQAAYLILEPEAPRTVVALAPCVGSLSRTPLLAALKED